ncbi:hypothetical protein ACOSQ4_015661 [Xanthoceras sorbifolium]
MEKNLRDQKISKDFPPNYLLFTFTLWYIWKWRCCVVFEDGFQVPSTPQMIILKASKQWWEAMYGVSSCISIYSAFMAWEPPMAGWVKLNVDGSRDNQTGSIAAGGVARDLNSNWVRGFAMHLGAGNILEAELNAVLLGLDMVWDAGFRKVIVESDCLEVVTLIQNDCSINNPLWWLI